ncbi:MAG: hypothetical protein ABIP94_08145 [Planctomycetota bacterium]
MNSPRLAPFLVAAATSPTRIRHPWLSRTAPLLLAGALAGQSPLATAYAGVGVGAVGSQIFFDLNVLSPTGITIKSLDVNLSSPLATPGTITVLTVFPAGTYTAPLATTTAAWWTGPSGAGPVVAAGVGKPTHVCLTPPIFLPFGVQGVVVQYTGVAPQYTVNLPFPLAPWPTSFTAELVLSRGDYAPVFWAPTIPGPNTFDGAIHYDVGASLVCVPCASKVSLGAGCASLCPPFPVLHIDAGFPVEGETLEVVTTGASPCALVGITAFGLGLPCGAGGCPICLPSCACLAYVQLDVTVIGFPVAGQWTSQLPIPLSPLLCGFPFFAQSFTLESPFAIPSSNYLALIVGS